MTFADFAHTDRHVSVSIASRLRAAAHWFAARRDARAKKAVLKSLLFAPEYRLRDLGITRDELLDAIAGRRQLGR